MTVIGMKWITILPMFKEPNSPTLSALIAELNFIQDSVKRKSNQTGILSLSYTRQIVFWSLPITFLFIVLRAHIVRVILGSRSFSWDNTRLVAASLAIFSISIMAQGLIALLARAYYAGGNTKRPLLINFLSSCFIVLFSGLFLYIFEHFVFFKDFIESLLKVSNIPGTEILMLPLAYSLGTILNLILLWIFIKRDFMKKEIRMAVFLDKTPCKTKNIQFILHGY